MKIIAVSDLHGYLPRDIPSCDVLIIGGDICPHFDKKAGSMRDVHGQAAWLDTAFRDWLTRVPADTVVGIWGNHDFIGTHPDLVPKLPWTLLEDSETTVKGLRIYGTPYTNRFYDWAFMLDDEQMIQKMNMIPDGLDILVSHGPPLWVCDRAFGPTGNHAGSEALYDRLRSMSTPPRAVICGHIHAGRGFGMLPEVISNPKHASTLIHNVSGVDETYSPHEPMWVEIEL